MSRRFLLRCRPKQIGQTPSSPRSKSAAPARAAIPQAIPGFTGMGTNRMRPLQGRAATSGAEPWCWWRPLVCGEKWAPSASKIGGIGAAGVTELLYGAGWLGSARDDREMRRQGRAREVKFPWCQDAGEIREPTKRGREPVDMMKSARTLQDLTK